MNNGIFIRLSILNLKIFKEKRSHIYGATSLASTSTWLKRFGPWKRSKRISPKTVFIPINLELTVCILLYHFVRSLLDSRVDQLQPSCLWSLDKKNLQSRMGYFYIVSLPKLIHASKWKTSRQLNAMHPTLCGNTAGFS